MSTSRIYTNRRGNVGSAIAILNHNPQRDAVVVASDERLDQYVVVLPPRHDRKVKEIAAEFPDVDWEERQGYFVIFTNGQPIDEIVRRIQPHFPD